MNRERTKAERKADEASANLRKVLSEDNPKPDAVAKARRELALAWRAVNQQRERMR